MKVVLIAESEDTISEYTAFLEEAGADVITYRWFLKALDNLTEIQPHIIIVSALDFPRHWKTLFTHIEAGEVKTQPLVYLITDPSFTASEKKKAMFLGAQDIFFSPLTNRDRNSLLSMLPAGMGIEPPAPKKPEQIPESGIEEDNSQETSPSPAVSEASLSENSEYAELKKQAESQAVAENKIHNISAAEANAFDLIDSEISNLENDDGPADDIAEVTDDVADGETNNLVVESADEDILTKLEDEMTESETDATPSPVQESVPSAESEPETESEPDPVFDDDITPVPQPAYEEPAPAPESEPVSETKPEPEPAYEEPAPEPAVEPVPEPAVERPEQVTWSAPIDENEDAIQFSFINPRSGLVVTGSVESYDHPTIRFVPDTSESVEGIRFGQILDQCKFCYEGETVKARAQVRGLGKSIEFCLLY